LVKAAGDIGQSNPFAIFFGRLGFEDGSFTSGDIVLQAGGGIGLSGKYFFTESAVAIRDGYWACDRECCAAESGEPCTLRPGSAQIGDVIVEAGSGHVKAGKFFVDVGRHPENSTFAMGSFQVTAGTTLSAVQSDATGWPLTGAPGDNADARCLAIAFEAGKSSAQPCGSGSARRRRGKGGKKGKAAAATTTCSTPSSKKGKKGSTPGSQKGKKGGSTYSKSKHAKVKEGKRAGQAASWFARAGRSAGPAAAGSLGVVGLAAGAAVLLLGAVLHATGRARAPDLLYLLPGAGAPDPDTAAGRPLEPGAETDRLLTGAVVPTAIVC
jgi:hypothetical protein